MQLGARRRRIRGDREKRRILLEQGVRTLVRHGYPRFVRLALRIISLGFGHRDVGRGCEWMCMHVHVYLCMFNATSFTGVMHNLSSLAVFARGLTLFVIQDYRIQIP